ncbi:MAG: cell division protein CrgA [Actinobacteria bacterium]|nr:cell division protein CrgA [Actinomycetota bacterium]
MAPPKRKTTGRVTPKGTGSSRGPSPAHAGAMAKEAAHHESSVTQSSRYTPPTPKEFYESPRWIPILMFAFIGLGVVSILTRYLIFENTNSPVLVGLGLMMAGLFTATKWR